MAKKVSSPQANPPKSASSKRLAPKSRASAAKVLIANGVNLDLLGRREAQHYGSFTLADLEASLHEEALAMAKIAGLGGIELSFFQSNDEAEFLAFFDRGWDGIVLNAAAWTHTSLALADRLKALGVPYIETHISNIAAREPFRHHSFAAPAAAGVVFGLGMDSYRVALFGLCRVLARKAR